MRLPLGCRRVLITGGGSGIGRAVAEGLLQKGARVAVLGRRRERLEALAEAWPGQVEILALDLSAGTAGVLERAKALLGGLDGLVCAAGVAHHQAPGAISEAALREQLEVNLVAPLRLGADALRVLEPGGGVVFIASNLAHRPIESSAVYSASKAGLLAAMRSLASAGLSRGLRLNAVSPGVVDTETVRERREALLAEAPLGRLGAPAEIAEAVIFLLGASWVSGSEWLLDGGGLLPATRKPPH